jgi:hypothetical protein
MTSHLKWASLKQNSLLNKDSVLEELRSTIHKIIELTDKVIKEQGS